MTASEFQDTFDDFISPIKDPRIKRRQLHTLAEVFFLVLVATICGAEGWKSIEYFGKLKIDLMRKFYPYKNGIPSDCTIRVLFRRIGPKFFQDIFYKWAKSLTLPTNLNIAIDGKTSRGSVKESGVALHTVSAIASEAGLVLGQQKVADKSNEITGIPQLLEGLDIQGGMITIDAMGCQKKICEEIVNKGNDYCISLKESQPSLYDEVKSAFKNRIKLRGVTLYETEEKGHGREEKRTYRALPCPKKTQKTAGFKGLQSIIEVTRQRTVTKAKKTTTTTHYYICSKKADAEKIGQAIRSHWAIENNLHWVLDVVFKDDESTIRKGNAPINMVMIKQFALNLVKSARDKYETIKWLRAGAGWNEEVLLKILAQIKPL